MVDGVGFATLRGLQDAYAAASRMSFSAIFALAVGLAMDAMAVAAARGLAAPVIRVRHVVLVALYFGGFQALMPVLGFVAGAQLGPLVEPWDHWIVFLLFAVIGGKLLWEARSAGQAERAECERRHFAPAILLALAVATSIDALAAGLTLPMLGAPLGLAVATIGITTAVLSGLGLCVGRLFGPLLGKRLDLAGGVVLIGFGVKTLVEHLSA